MAKKKIIRAKTQPCAPACTKVVKFMTDHSVAANIGISIPPYTKIAGYRHINIFVRFTQEDAAEPPVDLGVIFAFDSRGTMGARRYVTNFIEVSGSGTWHGSPHNISTYVARFPVMGPYVEVFVYKRAPVARTVSVWGYLVS